MNTQLKNTPPKKIKYIALQDWDKHHDFPSVRHFRKLLQSASKNGLDKVVRKVGGLIVIKEEEFFEWVDKQPYECLDDRRDSGLYEENRNKRLKEGRNPRGRPRKINIPSNKEEDQNTG